MNSHWTIYKKANDKTEVKFDKFAASGNSKENFHPAMYWENKFLFNDMIRHLCSWAHWLP